MKRSFLVVASLFFIVCACSAGSGDPVGAPCNNDSDCASGICGGPDCKGFCKCGKDSDCPVGQHCGATTDCGGACS